MILLGWLKRVRAGRGFSAFSASSWDRVCSVLENIEGIGCQIVKEPSGKSWKIVVDGYSSDVAFPEGVSPAWDEAATPEPDAQPFPSDVVSINTSGEWKKTPILAVGNQAPASVLARTSDGKLALRTPATGTKLTSIYGEDGSNIAKVNPGAVTYTWPYAFLTRNGAGDWKWVTPSSSLDPVVTVLCRTTAGQMNESLVVEFTCPVGSDPYTGPATDTIGA